jgi:hypothetical protein
LLEVADFASSEAGAGTAAPLPAPHKITVADMMSAVATTRSEAFGTSPSCFMIGFQSFIRVTTVREVSRHVQESARKDNEQKYLLPWDTRIFA